MSLLAGRRCLEPPSIICSVCDKGRCQRLRVRLLPTVDCCMYVAALYPEPANNSIYSNSDSRCKNREHVTSGMGSTHVLYTGGLPACHIHLLSLFPAHRANDQTRRHASFEVHKSSHRPRPASLATSCSPNSSSRFCKAASRAPPACFLRGMPPRSALLVWLAQPTSPIKVRILAGVHACILHASRTRPAAAMTASLEGYTRTKRSTSHT